MCEYPVYLVKMCNGTTRRLCSKCLRDVMQSEKIVFSVKVL